MEKQEALSCPDKIGHALDGGRIGQIPASRRVGNEEMVFHQRNDDFGIGLVEANPRSNGRSEFHPNVGVIPRAAFSNVMEQRAEEKQVRSVDTVGQEGSIGYGF